MAPGDGQQRHASQELSHLGPVARYRWSFGKTDLVVPRRVDRFQPLGMLGVEVGQLAKGGLPLGIEVVALPLSPHELPCRLECVPKSDPVERLQRPQSVLPSPMRLSKFGVLGKDLLGPAIQPEVDHVGGEMLTKLIVGGLELLPAGRDQTDRTLQPEPFGHWCKGWPETLRPE